MYKLLASAFLGTLLCHESRLGQKGPTKDRSWIAGGLVTFHFLPVLWRTCRISEIPCFFSSAGLVHTLDFKGYHDKPPQMKLLTVPHISPHCSGFARNPYWPRNFSLREIKLLA